jgi:acyl carrier protein
MDIFGMIANALADRYGLDASEITPESTFESLGIDSLDIVEMIMDLETELGVELEMEDQNITTFGELAAFIDSKLN